MKSPYVFFSVWPLWLSVGFMIAIYCCMCRDFFFLWLGSVPWQREYPTVCLSIRLLIQAWVVSTVWLSGVKLLWDSAQVFSYDWGSENLFKWGRAIHISFSINFLFKSEAPFSIGLLAFFVFIFCKFFNIRDINYLSGRSCKYSYQFLTVF